MKPQDFILCRTGKVIRTRAGYWAFIPNPLPPGLAWSARLVANLADAARAVGELVATARYLPESRVCAGLFLREEACASARIDGLVARPIDLYLAETSPASAAGLDQAASQAQRAVQALHFAIQQALAGPFSLTGLQTTHAQLQAAEIKPGPAPSAFRRTQNWVGPPGASVETAPFVPPPADRLPAMLSRLEAFVEGPHELPPLIRIGMLHYQLEALHPFESANGRIGRIVNSALLSAWGEFPYPLLHLSAYLETHQGEYFGHLMAVSQESAWEAWLAFFLRGIHVSALETQERLHRLADLRKRYQETIAASRAASRLSAVLDHLLAQPVTTINRVAEALQVNFPVAQRYIRLLEAAGIVREITGQARNRLYCAEGVLEVFAS